MKNLMTFAHPAKRFDLPYQWFVRMQIDHAIGMGWSPENIILATNFDYEYGGIKAIVLGDDTYCPHRKRASKINMICELIRQHKFDETVWFHDFDAWQGDELPDVLDEYDAAFTDYATNAMWNTGSFFFKPSALDIFERIQQIMNTKRVNEEIALKYITDAGEFAGRFFKLNGTYNHGRMRDTEKTYAAADKPIKVFHFDPRMTSVYFGVKPLLPQHLVSLFEQYGFQ